MIFPANETGLKPLNAFMPEIGDFFLIDVKAENINQGEIPESSISISWTHIKDEIPGLNELNFKIFIDGIKHKYFVPAGENKEWAFPGSNNLITGININVPEIEGLRTNIEKIELKRRTIIAFDSYINYYLRKSFNIKYINRMLIPAYIFMLLSIILFLIYRSLFRNTGNNKPLKTILFSLLAVLVLFSFYFTAQSFFTSKSYFDAYKKYISSGKLDKTYRGFYDFENFINWADGKIPKGENIIVLLRGEPVYIMSELAYNLYPRDLKFINISGKDPGTVSAEIKDINNKNSGKYRYVIILSSEDISGTEQLELIDKYRQNGGFIYWLNKD
ncbi:MAG: hypothetical protein M1409_01390 [Actinobacteria bacterium]|nr:hypothetical protein [Actinomycetota bacterium]